MDKPHLSGPFWDMPPDERPDCDYSIEWSMGDWRFSIEFGPTGGVYLHTVNLHTGESEYGSFDMTNWAHNVK